jgi:hypothetical protein
MTSTTPLEPAARENLIRLAKLYSGCTGYTLQTIARYAHGNPRFLPDLVDRHGAGKRCDKEGSFTFRKYDELVEWFRERWPRPYVPGESLKQITVTASDRKRGCPKIGDIIVKDPNNPSKQRLVAAENTKFSEFPELIDLLHDPKASNAKGKKKAA